MPWPSPNPFFLDHYLTTPSFDLHSASRYGNVILINTLISKGHDPNKLEPCFFGTPLHVAIACNQLPSVLALLVCGANPEEFTPQNRCMDTGHAADNCLGMAVRWGRRDMVKLFWDVGVKRDGHSEEDVSCARRGMYRIPSLLEIAAEGGHWEIVDDLLEWCSGCCIGWKPEEKNLALLNASRRWEAGVVDVLISKCEFEKEILARVLDTSVKGGPSSFSYCYTASDWTIEQSQQEARTIEILLDAGADADLDSLLSKVSFRPCEVESMKLLLQRGANPNAKSSHGRTAINMAARRSLGGPFMRESNEEGIKLLIQHGADIGIADDEGKTPIHFLIRDNNIPLLELCLSKGSWRIPKNTQGETVLHEACLVGNVEVVEVLLEAGFDANERSSNGWRPLRYAMMNQGPNLSEIRHLLIAYGAHEDTMTDQD